VIYPTTTYRLLPLVASNIRVMASFDAVMRRRRTVSFIPRKAPPTMSCDFYLQYCWIISSSEFHQWGKTTPFRGWECSTERRSRDRGAAGDPAWMMVVDKGGLGEILILLVYTVHCAVNAC